jgi:hypothetical protein
MDGVRDNEITAAKQDSGACDPQNGNQKNRHFYLPDELEGQRRKL